MSTNALRDKLRAVRYVIACLIMAAMLVGVGIYFFSGASGPHLDCGYDGAKCATSSSSLPATLAVVGILVGFGVLFLLLTKYSVAIVGRITSAMLLIGWSFNLLAVAFSHLACGLNDGTVDYSGCAGHSHPPFLIGFLAILLIAGVSRKIMKDARRDMAARALAASPRCTQCAAPLATTAANFCGQCGSTQ
jgi:hypothetical protein